MMNNGGFRKGMWCVDQIGEKAPKKCSVYVGFTDLEKAYDRVNRETLWKILRMYNVGGKLLNGIKGMCNKSLACI